MRLFKAVLSQVARRRERVILEGSGKGRASLDGETPPWGGVKL